MIISRAPYRVSFLGGGTDFPAWYRENPGAVLSVTIDKYCYISARWLPPYFEHKHRIVWSKIELPMKITEIEHPKVRETLKYFGITDGIEIHHSADLPARAGMGTSSSFTVALIQALSALRDDKIKNLTMVPTAIYIDQDCCKAGGGSQDQTAAGYGGLNRIDFSPSDIEVKPIRSDNLGSHIMLFFTGFQRNACDIEKAKIDRIAEQKAGFNRLYEMVGEGEACLNAGDMIGFGKLVSEGWQIKRGMAPNTSTDYIDFLYDKGMKAGALGGKLLGAGGGGFLCFIVEPDRQVEVKEALKDLLNVPVKFSYKGSEVIVNNGN